MRFAIIFLYLFAFLLKGSGSDYVLLHQGKIAHAQLPSSVKGQTRGHAHTSFKDVAVDNDGEYLINDSDSEDEDNDSFSAGENALKPHCYASLPWLSNLLYRYKSFKAPPHARIQAAHIYIFQRTLRI